MCSVNIKEDPVKEHRKNTKKFLWPLLRSYRWSCYSFIIYSLKQHGSHFPSWQEKKKKKMKLLSSDTENREILLMWPNFYNPEQCTGSILSLYSVRNNFMSVRKHVEKLQQECSVKLVILYSTLASFTGHGTVCLLSVIKSQRYLEI